jgi:hypothetical protein
MKTIDVKRYASELLFHAAVGNPWEVGQAEFIAIVAMLGDGTELTSGERDDVAAFFAVACDFAAEVDHRAADAATIYKLACVAAKRKGARVHADGAISPL